VDLELIEHPRSERRLCRIRAVDEDIPVAGGSLRLRHRADDPAGDICAQWILRDRRPRRAVTGHEDWDAIVVITAPVIDLFNRIATGQDRAGRSAFGKKLLPDPRRLRVRPRFWSKPVPLMQPHEAIATWLAGPWFAPATYPSSDIDIKTQEEVYVVVRGSGRMKLDDEIVELREWDAVRVPPGTWRGYEAGPDGLEILVIGAPSLGDAPREDVNGQRDWWAHE
jgi:mannose-6-phosphate isomerase-like protein (cupin superfamily)